MAGGASVGGGGGVARSRRSSSPAPPATSDEHAADEVDGAVGDGEPVDQVVASRGLLGHGDGPVGRHPASQNPFSPSDLGSRGIIVARRAGARNGGPRRSRLAAAPRRGLESRVWLRPGDGARRRRAAWRSPSCGATERLAVRLPVARDRSRSSSSTSRPSRTWPSAAARRGPGRGGRPADHRGRVPARVPAPARSCTSRCTRAGSTRRCCERLGLEEQVLRGARRASAWSRWRRERLGLSVDDETLRARSGHLAGVPGERPLHRRGRDPPAPELQGISEAEFEESLRRALHARAAGGARHRRGRREPERGGARVPPAQRAGQGRVRAGADAAPFRRRLGRPTTRCSARFEAKRDAYRIPGEARRLVRAGRPRRRCSRGSRSRTRELDAYYQEHRDEFAGRGGLRQPHPGEGEGLARGDGGPPRRGGAEARAGGCSTR